MEKIKIGQVVNVVGLKGEIKVYHYSDYRERFEEFDQLYLQDRQHTIERVRYQKNMVILKLSGIDDRNQAEAQKGKDVFITEAELRQLPKGTYYIRDLIGMEVILEDGQPLGVLNNVIQNSAQDLYEIKRENGKTLLIPGVDEFVLNIDMETKKIMVRLIDGMLDL